jgi:hypothetical protein
MPAGRQRQDWAIHIWNAADGMTRGLGHALVQAVSIATRKSNRRPARRHVRQAHAACGDRLAGHTPIKAVAVSPDGKFIATRCR